MQESERHKRHESGCEHALTQIYDYDPHCEQPTLGAQGIGAAGIAAALGADIHTAPQLADDKAAEKGAQQISQ